jgi:hypothetical protein
VEAHRRSRFWVQCAAAQRNLLEPRLRHVRIFRLPMRGGAEPLDAMRITAALLNLGGGIFVLLGLLHGMYTFLDIRRPRRLVPQDPAVSQAMVRTPLRLARGGTTMWRAWVGFNFSHSLGAVVFGALCCCAGAVPGLVHLSPWILFLFAVIAAIYLILSVLYWFRIPTACICVALLCLAAAWIMYTFEWR